jgi:Carboxypeptidase regulatory-like domain
MRKFAGAAFAFCLFLSLNAYPQSQNATVGGTVQDSTGAFIPGVTITATNTATGVVTTVVSNEAGAYQFASLQTGTYELKAELPGFQTALAKGFQLFGAQQARLNFTLQVGAAAGTTVDVSVAADTLLATSSNSVGSLLPEYKVRDLPLQSRDVFGLVGNTAGVQRSTDGNNFVANFAGGRISQVNTTRDGVNVSAGRFEDGAWSLTYTSPDLVEEVKVVVAPIDAQTSRGTGQVSMVTRSGTNQFRGSAFWVNHNSALDASNWFNNFSNVPKDYDNRNQYGARLGGPIVKNKTFFFLLFEGQRDLKRQQATGAVLSPLARQGIFRYFPGADNANFTNPNPAVDRFGTPTAPKNANGPLSYIDLFGNCSYNGSALSNCKTYRDSARSAISASPFIQESLSRMPLPNEYTGSTGDGLNTAIIRFTRRVEGFDLTNGNGTDVDRAQYNARIDHNFNSRNKLSIIGTKEHTWGGAAQAVQRAWPTAFDGQAIKRPDVYIITFTSTLSNTLLNELRLGRRRSIDLQNPPANRSDAIGAQALKSVSYADGVPYQVTPTNWSFLVYGGFGRYRGHVSPLYSIGDDISWSHGKHAFKGGYELRSTKSSGFGDPAFTPVVTLGAGSVPVSGLDGNAFTGLTSVSAGFARSLLTDLTGSIDHVNQSYGILSASNTTLQASPTIPVKFYRQHQAEMNAYFKDDWKFRSDLTLNLGVHWEYFGQPWEENGLAARIIGDESALTNVQCTSSPGTVGFTSTCTNLTQVQFVGKNSTHPNVNVNLKGNDKNSFAPAIGLSWNMPWFGKGKTVLRTGYGMTYQGALRNFITVDSTIGTVPGINLVGSSLVAGVVYNPATYTSLSTLDLPIPTPPGTATVAPFTVQPTDRTLTISTYNRVNPYVQNWNLEIQREIAKNTTVEVRYIGSKGTKLWGTLNLNQVDALHHNLDLYNAFNAVRAGGESPLLNSIMQGINFGGNGVVNNTSITGAAAVRANTTTRAQIANGSVGAFINTLNTTNTGTGQSVTGAVLRRAGFPENYISVNPQYAAVSMLDNLGNSTYHSMQLQFTKRLTNGFTNTTTWTWSKAMGESDTDAGATYRDPTRRNLEKSLLGYDRTHQITSNGSYELPFGTNHFLLGGAPGWAQNLVGKWQLGGILNYITGAPMSFTTGTGTISTTGAAANIVGSLPRNVGNVAKLPTSVTYFNGYSTGTDPGLAQVSPACAGPAAPTGACNGLLSGYTNKAIQGPNGQNVLVNPQPGEIGNLGWNTVKGPGTLNFDMDLIKRFKIHENQEFEFRLDAINILNHPNFGTPTMSINSTSFGRITTASPGRSFVVNTRVNF